MRVPHSSRLIFLRDFLIHHLHQGHSLDFFLLQGGSDVSEGSENENSLPLTTSARGALHGWKLLCRISLWLLPCERKIALEGVQVLESTFAL